MFVTTVAAAMAMLLPTQSYAPAEYGGQQRVAPRGSYAASCSGSYVNQGRLYADCRDSRGQIRGTSIELNRCSDSDIGNDNGLLVCGRVRGNYESGRPGNGDRPGGGRPGAGNGGGFGGRNSITVYRDSDYRGQSQTFNGEIANLYSSGFNDVISSMQFRGTWIACTDANFRGQCITFDNDVRNLDRWGLNDKISSLRPAGRGDRPGNRY